MVCLKKMIASTAEKQAPKQETIYKSEMQAFRSMPRLDPLEATKLCIVTSERWKIPLNSRFFSVTTFHSYGEKSSRPLLSAGSRVGFSVPRFSPAASLVASTLYLSKDVNSVILEPGWLGFFDDLDILKDMKARHYLRTLKVWLKHTTSEEI